MEETRQHPFVESRSFKRTLKASVRVGQVVPILALIVMATHVSTPKLAIEITLAAWASMFALIFLAAYYGGELPGSESEVHSRQAKPGCFWSLVVFCAIGFVIMSGILTLILTGSIL